MTKQARNEAIYALWQQGIKQGMIAQAFGIRQNTVSVIVRALKAGVGCTQRGGRGAKPKLTQAQKDELATLLQQGPQAHGYHLWNKQSVGALIEQQFQVVYHKNYIYQVMRAIGFSAQKPKKKITAKTQTK